MAGLPSLFARLVNRGMPPIGAAAEAAARGFRTALWPRALVQAPDYLTRLAR